MKAPRFRDVDVPAKDALQVSDEANMIEESCVRVEINEKVDIALSRRLRPRDRSKHARVAGVVLAQHDEQFVTLRSDNLPNSEPLTPTNRLKPRDIP
jgi:hypothetical protein